MNKTTMMLLAALPLLALGCKKASDNPEAVAKFASFRDRACACKDAECATKVAMDLKTWSDEFQKTEAAKDKISDDDDKKTTAALADTKQCLAKAMAAGHPAAGGAEPGSAAPAAGSAEPATGSAAEPPPPAPEGSAN